MIHSVPQTASLFQKIEVAPVGFGNGQKRTIGSFLLNLTDNRQSMNINKPASPKQPSKAVRPKKKRNLDNKNLKPFFGKSPENIWDKDIFTGEGNVSF
jgi:hypothetical protein